MRRTNRTMAAIVISAALVLGVAACSSSKKSSEATGTTTTTASSSDKSFQVSTGDGEVSLSLDGNLPPNWPKDFPLQDGAIPAGSGSLAGSSSGKQVAVFKTSDSAQDTFNFYKNNSALTVTDSKSIGVGPAFAGNISISGTYSGRVTIVSLSGSTTIVITLDATAGGSGSNTTTTTSTASTSTVSTTTLPGY